MQCCDLSSKTAIVTGASRGIGKAIALKLASNGAAVVLVSRSEKELTVVQSQIEKSNGKARVIAADVSNSEAFSNTVKSVTEKMGNVDILINNAGISIRHDFLDITPENWNAVLGVNLTGVFNMAQTAARHMVERGSGVIVNAASTAGTTGYPHYADYSASKGGVIALTLAMALELAPTVRVTAVSPGYTLTPMQRAEYTDEMLAAVNRKIPLGRHADPAEMASLYVYLASEDAAFASGQVYVMDGAETTGGLCSQWAHE